MNAKLQWVAGTVVLCLLILVGGWFGLVSPQKAKANAYKAQATKQVQQQAEARGQLAVLTSEAHHITGQQAKLAKAQSLIPLSPALPTLIRQLTSVTTASGVDLSQVSPAEPTEVLGSATAAAGSSGSTPTLYSIPINLTLTGGYFDAEAFLANLESLPRALQVTSVVVTGEDSGTATSSSSTSTSSSSSTSSSASSSSSSAPLPGSVQVTITARVFMTSTNLTASASS